MLKIVNYNCDEYEFPCLIVLGCFDAIHAGHAELLKKAKLQAKINGLDLGVMVFSEGKSGKQIYTFGEKLDLLENYNVKFVLKIDFTEEFKKTKPLDFLQIIEDKINVKAYMSGKDFRFGEGAKGKSSTLKNYAEDEENGVWYMPVKDVMCGSEKISTTLVKKLLAEGNVKSANELLGANYFVCAEVISGADRGGKTLGFPTVNLKYPENKAELKYGVYSVKSVIDGVEYAGMANYGPRPTFGEEEPLLEAYLDGFSGDLYGKEIKIEFIDFIREVRRFDNANGLKEQLLQDLSVIKGTAVAETAVASDEPDIKDNAETSVSVIAESMPEAEKAAEAQAAAEEAEKIPAEAVEEVQETETSVESLTEESVEETAEQPVEQLGESATEEVAEMPAEAVEEVQETETSVESLTEESVEETAEQPVEQLNESATEEVAEMPVEAVAEAETAIEEAPNPAEEADTTEEIQEPVEEISAETKEEKESNEEDFENSVFESDDDGGFDDEYTEDFEENFSEEVAQKPLTEQITEEALAQDSETQTDSYVETTEENTESAENGITDPENENGEEPLE